MLVLVLVLKDSLRTKMQSLSWSLSLKVWSLSLGVWSLSWSLSLLLKSLSLNKSPWSCPCVQFYLKVNYVLSIQQSWSMAKCFSSGFYWNGMCMVQVSLLLIYLLSYTLNPVLAVARVVLPAIGIWWRIIFSSTISTTFRLRLHMSWILIAQLHRYGMLTVLSTKWRAIAHLARWQIFIVQFQCTS